MINILVLLPAAAIFFGLISLSINASEQQITDTTKTVTDKDDSNSMNEEQNIEMSIKNNSSAGINDDSNFTSIFDGKTLDGWKMAGDGRFVILESDAALESEGGLGLLWYSEKIYKNFMLKLEWKVSDEGDNSGVFVRFPDPDDNPNIAVREGLEYNGDSNTRSILYYCHKWI
jgi:Domain of Unknown Function (DUF1080)